MLSYVPIYFYKENVKLLLYLYVSVCISMGTVVNVYGYNRSPCVQNVIYSTIQSRAMQKGFTRNE
jgi:hypothetical protein